MYSPVNRQAVRRRIRYRIKNRVIGSALRPRLAVFRSGKHIYAQALDDSTGTTMAASSTMMPGVKDASLKGGDVEAAKKVGAAIAEKLKTAGIETIVFDRGGFQFHGRVKALADAAREAGLKF